MAKADADAKALAEEKLAAESRYFSATRRLSVGFLFALPLVILYEFGVILARSDANAIAQAMRHSVSWLDRPTQMFGVNLMLILNGAVILGIIIALVHAGRLKKLNPETFLGMLLESVLYAMLLGPLALLPITGELRWGGFSPRWNEFVESLFISSGAGFYEEFFFRFIMLGALFYLAKEIGELKPVTAGAVALVVSAGVFSGMHFISPGESPDLGMFLFRLVAGILLGLIYLTRGFGVAAWTHALYDVYVISFMR